MTTLAARRALDRALAGERLTPAEGATVFRDASFHDLAYAAHERRKALTDATTATYVVDRNINYTNVCNVFCGFCAFYRGPNDKDAYTLAPEQVFEKIDPLVAWGGTQVLLQGGLNDAVSLAYVEDLFRKVRARYPKLDIHSLTATEVEFYANREGLTIGETLARLKAAGLKSLPGGGMEILTQSVRDRVSPKKTTGRAYIDIHRAAHALGMTSTATMMFGMDESVEERVEHLDMVRALQDESIPGKTCGAQGLGGFTAFIPWTYQTDGSTPLKARPTTSEEYLRIIALARLYLDNFAHIQSGWVTEGAKIAQAALFCGADDWGGVLMEENVISAAGTLFGMTPGHARRELRGAGFVPAQRDTYYNILARFPEATPEESWEALAPQPERLAVHLKHVGNRGRAPRAPVRVGGVADDSANAE
ncbi:MAG: CofH family radical SAM protein [Thermoplasmatota archaeon]